MIPGLADAAFYCDPMPPAMLAKSNRHFATLGGPWAKWSAEFEATAQRLEAEAKMLSALWGGDDRPVPEFVGFGEALGR